MAKHYVSTKQQLSEVIYVENIIEACWQNSLIDSEEPHESEYNKVVNDDKLSEKINKELVDAIAEIFKRNGITLDYEYIEYDKDEVFEYIENWGPVKLDSLIQIIGQYYDRDNLMEDLKALENEGKIKIENGVVKALHI
jgi:hypothetical protein